MERIRLVPTKLQRVRPVLRRPDVLAAFGGGHTPLDDAVKAGSFPPPFKIHGAQGRAVAWFADEVEAWQRWRRAERDGRAAEGSSWREYLDDGTPDAA